MENKKRFFAFGCSFTSYTWPSWADILARHYHGLGWEVYNLGMSGCGNKTIMNNIVAADVKFNFTEDDVIVVMWSTFNREDRIAHWGTDHDIPPQFGHGGGIFNHPNYDADWIKQYWSLENDVINNVSIIHTVNKAYPNIRYQGCLEFLELHGEHFSIDNDNQLFKNLIKYRHTNQFPDQYTDIEFKFKFSKFIKDSIESGITCGHYLPSIHHWVLENRIFPSLNCGTVLSEDLKQWCLEWDQRVLKDARANPDKIISYSSLFEQLRAEENYVNRVDSIWGVDALGDSITENAVESLFSEAAPHIGFKKIY